jgi:anti-sigma B factor antagonist
MSSLDMQHQHHIGATVIALDGEIDLASAPRLQAYIAEVRQRPADHLVIDMAKVSFMDSSGLRVLLDAYAFAQEHGGDLHLAALQGEPARVIEITRVSDRLRLHTTPEIALAAIASAPDLAAPTGDAKRP